MNRFYHLISGIFGNGVDGESSHAASVATFLMGLTIVFTLPVIGRFPIPEFFTVAIFVWVIWMRLGSGEWPHPILQSRTFKRFMACLLVSFLGYILSDLVRATPLHDLARGWARWVFLAIDLVAIAFLVGLNWQSIRWLVLGYVFGVIGAALTIGPQLGDYWKGGFAYPISFLLPILVSERRPVVLSLLFGALGVLHVYLGARSLGANCILAGAAIWLSTLSRRNRLIAVWLSVPVAIVLLSLIYVRSGVGERNEGSTTERTAMLEFALESFVSSPLVGQGSWFTKGSKVDAFFARRSELRGDSNIMDLGATDEIVIHSQILVAFAEGGILGGMFFLCLLVFFLWGLWFAATHSFTLRPLVLILLLNGTWDLAMSTFSGYERVFIALCCAMLIALYGLARQQRLSS